MRMERRPRIPRLSLPLQPIKSLIETPRNRFLRHRQLMRCMVIIRREFRRRRIDRPRRAQPQHVVDNELFDLRVGDDVVVIGRGFDGEEVWDAGRDDGVEGGYRRQVVQGVRGGIGEGDVVGDGGVADEGGVVAAVLELGEQGGFVEGEVEADEVGEFGGDGDEEFLGDDQFNTRGL